MFGFAIGNAAFLIRYNFTSWVPVQLLLLCYGLFLHAHCSYRRHYHSFTWLCELMHLRNCHHIELSLSYATILVYYVCAIEIGVCLYCGCTSSLSYLFQFCVWNSLLVWIPVAFCILWCLSPFKRRNICTRLIPIEAPCMKHYEVDRQCSMYVEEKPYK